MINDYFTLLASLEYNMQEIQKVQKLMNDLVDITVTVILRDFKAFVLLSYLIYWYHLFKRGALYKEI